MFLIIFFAIECQEKKGTHIQFSIESIKIVYAQQGKSEYCNYLDCSCFDADIKNKK